MKNKKNKVLGFTMIEIMIVLTIVSFLALFLVPAFNKPIKKQRITNATEALSLDLRWARSESIKRNAGVTITFTDGAPEAWQYVITSGADTLKTVDSADFKEFANVTLLQNFTADAVTFDPVRGVTDNTGTATFTLNHAGSDSNFQTEVALSLLGHVTVCSDTSGSNTAIPAFDEC